MSFRFKVFDCAEAFSNGGPINIYIYTNTFTLWHIMPLQNDIQNICSEFNSFVSQSVTCSKRNDMHMAEYILIC